MNSGACVAVNLNDRLDYFGATVNQTQRWSTLARGGDILLAHSVATDPAKALLAAIVPARGRVINPFNKSLLFAMT